MSRRSQSILAFFLILALYVSFVVIHQSHIIENAETKLKEHAQIIENSLWNLEKKSPIEYLSLAIIHEGYRHLWVDEKNGQQFLQLSGPALSKSNTLLTELKLLPITPLETDILHEGKPIGKLRVLYQSNAFFLYSYIFCLVGLFFFTILGVLKNIWAKNDLESIVAQRTKDLAKANRALKESETNLSITLDSIGDAVIATDVNGNITRMNPIAEKLTGYELDTVNGWPLSEIFITHDSENKKSVPNPYDMVMEAKDILELDGHTILTSQDGKEYLIAESGAPIRNAPGDIVGVVLVFRDITEQQRLEDDLRQSQKMDSIGMLAGGVAHDFNNMLAGILGYSELLESRLEDETLKEYTNTIIKSATRAADLTGKLLAFSRKGKIQSTNLDIHNIINEVKTLLSHAIDKKIELQIKLRAEHSIVMGDPAELQNAILNLAVNARDAMPNGGTLTITSQNTHLNEAYCTSSTFEIEPGHYLEISVKDTGVGMDDLTKKSIFDPFYTTKDIGKGTGLGLSAVYGTIKQHNGAIIVFSESGKGSSFHLYLPISNTTIQESPKIDVTETKQPSSCILVVDDEDIIRSMNYELLKGYGYKVLLAKDGEQAILTYQKHQNKIDVVILDMVMPKISGKECFHEIRAINPDAKVLLSSGFSQNNVIESLMSDGAYGFIKKPYNFNDLHTLISETIGKQ